MSLPALELQRLSHRFGKFRAIRDLEFTVPQGEIYGLLGLNGAGKTTTLRIALGLLRIQSGDVRVLGESARRPAARRELGVLFEDFAPLPYLSGRQHLAMHARLHGVARSSRRRCVDEWLTRVGLTEHATKKTKRYSLGMRRRLGLACALVHAPKLILLDEPQNGLDPEAIRDVRTILAEVRAERGATVVFSSHVLAEVEQVASRLGILHEGALRAEGSLEDLTRVDNPSCRIRVGDLAAARAALGHEPAPGGPTSAGTAWIRTGAAPHEVPGIVRSLVCAGIDVFEVAPVKRTLEEVFRDAVRLPPEERP